MRLDSFERRFVFRVSRGLYLTMVALGALALAAGIVVLGYSHSPTLKKPEPTKPDPPGVAQVSADEVAKQIAAEKPAMAAQAPRSAAPVREPDTLEMSTEPTGPAPTDPLLLKARDLMDRIHTDFFPGDGPPWLAEMQPTCTQRATFGPNPNQCLTWENRKARDGVADLLERGTSELSNPNKVVLLEQVVAVLPLVAIPKPPEPTGDTSATASPDEKLATVPSPAGGAGSTSVPPATKLGKMLSRGHGRSTSHQRTTRTGADVSRPKAKVVNPRIVAVASLVDVSRAYRTPPAAVVGQVATILRTALTKGTGTASEDEQLTLLRMLLNLRKRDSTPETLAAFLGSWTAMFSVFDPTVPNQMQGFNNLWTVARALYPEQVVPTISTVIAVVRPLPAEDRALGVLVFERMLHKKMEAAQAAYRQAKGKYEADMAAREADYEARQLSKGELRRPSMTAIASAVGLIALVGLVLALLGIERNTRTMEQLLARMSADDSHARRTIPAQALPGADQVLIEPS